MHSVQDSFIYDTRAFCFEFLHSRVYFYTISGLGLEWLFSIGYDALSGDSAKSKTLISCVHLVIATSGMQVVSTMRAGSATTASHLIGEVW